MNHLCHEIGAPCANDESRVRTDYGLNAGDRPKAIFSPRVVRGKNDGALRAVSANELLRLVDVDDPSVLDDSYPVAQPFGFLHQMSSQKDCLAALANIAHQIPNRPPGL